MNVDQVRADYRAALGVFEPVILRRFAGTGATRPRFDTPCMARVQTYQAAELVGAIQQGDRRVIVMADDLVAAGFVLPVTSADKLLIDGKETAVQDADHTTRSLGGICIAIEIRVRG